MRPKPRCSTMSAIARCRAEAAWADDGRRAASRPKRRATRARLARSPTLRPRRSSPLAGQAAGGNSPAGLPVDPAQSETDPPMTTRPRSRSHGRKTSARGVKPSSIALGLGAFAAGAAALVAAAVALAARPKDPRTGCREASTTPRHSHRHRLPDNGPDAAPATVPPTGLEGHAAPDLAAGEDLAVTRSARARGLPPRHRRTDDARRTRGAPPRHRPLTQPGQRRRRYGAGRSAANFTKIGEGRIAELHHLVSRRSGA